jgi:curved DNA-binding protein CbpA
MDIDTALNELLLTRPVTKDQIKRAYHRMAMRFHPDKATHAEEKGVVTLSVESCLATG